MNPNPQPETTMRHSLSPLTGLRLGDALSLDTCRAVIRAAGREALDTIELDLRHRDGPAADRAELLALVRVRRIALDEEHPR